MTASCGLDGASSGNLADVFSGAPLAAILQDPAPGLTLAPSALAPDVDRTLPVGVGLKASEVAALDDIAAELGIARNAIMRFAIRYFLAEYEAGRVTLEVETETKNRLKM